MAVQQKSRAVDVAREHVEAWSNHDFDAARGKLADDVEVSVTTAQPIMSAINLIGIDDYMHGLIEFAQPIVPGSLRVLASTGDERGEHTPIVALDDLDHPTDRQGNRSADDRRQPRRT